MSPDFKALALNFLPGTVPFSGIEGRKVTHNMYYHISYYITLCNQFQSCRFPCYQVE